MTDKINDGGPVFPSGDFQNMEPLNGLTKREWFAGMALQGMLADSNDVPKSELKKHGVEEVHDYIAQAAFEYADAMIKESAS